jgi:hypothetical protein
MINHLSNTREWPTGKAGRMGAMPQAEVLRLILKSQACKHQRQAFIRADRVAETALVTRQCLLVFQPLDDLKQFLALLQPRLRIRGALQVLDAAIPVYYNGRRALHDEVHPFKIETMIHLVRGVRQDRKRYVERGAVAGSAI